MFESLKFIEGSDDTMTLNLCEVTKLFQSIFQ